MAALISFTYLFVAAICVSGSVFENRWLRKRPHRPELHPWDREILRHRLDPKWLYSRRLRYDYDYDYNNVRYDPAADWVSNEATSAANTEKLASGKARRKYLSTAIPPRSVGYTWSKEDDMSGHPQGLRHSMFRSRMDAVHSEPVTPDVDKWTLAKNSRVQPLKAKATQDQHAASDSEPKSTDGEGKIAETIHVEENSTTIGSNEEAGDPESMVDANENRTSEKEVKSEATDTPTGEKTGTTETVPESSGVEETTTPSVPDKTDASTVDGKISESFFPTTTVIVKETASTVHSTVDRSSPKEISPSTTTFPSTAVTDRETVSSTPSPASESSSEGISPSNTPLLSSVVTARETVSSTPSPASESSSEGISPSKTPLPSSVVTAIETVPSTPSTGVISSKIVSPSKISLPSSTVSVTETVSPTPSTAGDVSSKGGVSTPSAIPATERVIVLPRIHSARIVLSSVLLAIGLVAVAVAAVCIFRERRRKLKYDQLKLLP